MRGGGDERRAVGEAGPGAVRQRGVGLGQHLPVDDDVVGHRQAGERARRREGAEPLRRLPGERAAEHAAAAAEPHRHEFVGGGGEPRAGEADQHAAVHPGGEAVARFAGDRADVRQDQHRHMLVEQFVDAADRAGAVGRRTSANGASARDR